MALRKRQQKNSRKAHTSGFCLLVELAQVVFVCNGVTPSSSYDDDDDDDDDDVDDDENDDEDE